MRRIDRRKHKGRNSLVIFRWLGLALRLLYFGSQAVEDKSLVAHLSPQNQCNYVNVFRIEPWMDLEHFDNLLQFYSYNCLVYVIKDEILYLPTGKDNS